MLRRSHKKSRGGCAQCKRIHKKCDETRPKCVNCTTSRRQCSYLPSTKRPDVGDLEFIVSLGPDGGSQYPSPSSQNTAWQLTPATTPPPSEPYVNILHLELFQNMTSKSFEFLAEECSKEEWLGTLIKYTFQYPYLMYITLSHSAFHLSVQHPTRSSFYLTESSTLQSHALGLFNRTANIGSPANLIPSFLFSSVLGLNIFCHAFSTQQANFQTFLNKLIQSIHLLRGVKAVISDSWEEIKKSDIKSLIQTEDAFVARDDEITDKFSSLISRFLTHTRIIVSEREIYIEAIERLMWVYNTQPVSSEEVFNNVPTHARTVIAWPITLSAEYTQLLEERKPEALIVLAYFSILLYQRRAFWAVGDAGRSLLSAVEEELGREWENWLIGVRQLVPKA